MKKVRKMKKILEKIIAFILIVGIIIPTSKIVSAAENNDAKSTPSIVTSNSSNNLWVDASNDVNSDLDVVKWHYKSSEGKYYLFLPSTADSSNLTIWHTFSSNPKVNGVELKNGITTSVFSGGGTFTLKVGSTSCTLVVKQSKNIPAVFIQTKSGNLDKVHADKDYENESGNMLVVSEDGSFTNAEIDTIKGRGNSTCEAAQRLFGKYPYNIKLSSKINLLGMGKAKNGVY